jgi:hypothetical protein
VSAFSSVQVRRIYAVLNTLKTLGVVGQTQLSQELSVPPQAIFNFLRKNGPHRPKSDELLYRMLEHLSERKAEYREALRGEQEIESQLEELLKNESALESPLNDLFEYLSHVGALDKQKSRQFSNWQRGSYRIYRMSAPGQVVCSTLQIYGYSTRQKTPNFWHRWEIERGQERVARGNVFQFMTQLVFVALVEGDHSPGAPEEGSAAPPERRALAAGGATVSPWVGMSMIVLPDPGKAPLDGQFGIHLSFAEGGSYSAGKLLVVRERDRVFKLKSPGTCGFSAVQRELAAFSIAVSDSDFLASAAVGPVSAFQVRIAAKQ